MVTRDALPLLGNGIYSFGDAARYTGLRQGRIREWFRVKNDQQLFLSDYSGATDQQLVSFHDLIEVFIAGQLREGGVSMRTVRQVHAALKAQWDDPHPFCRPELRTEGKKIFYVGTDQSGREEIKEVLTGQRAFPEIISPFLKRLDYDHNSAFRWRIASGVEIDPTLCFGQPVAEQSKKPTYLLSTSFHANGKQADAVARWYGVTKDDVLAAVEFESKLAA